MPRLIAFYLPQFHPIPENDEWWGKGFTEWTNVGNAKPLFKGHYQPRVPSDLGYYDLRLIDIQKEQAKLAREHGIEGFCYWHYYFGNNKQLLEKPFKAILNSKEYDFPFCLGWANHSWYQKLFRADKKDKLLIEQLYPGEEDFINHFYLVLPAFKDSRYIKVDGRPIFTIFSPAGLPDSKNFIDIWQKLAVQNGIPGIHFIAYNEKPDMVNKLTQKDGFSGVISVRLYDVFKRKYSLIYRAYTKIMRLGFGVGRVLPYSEASQFFVSEEEKSDNVYPCMIPNWDHSPRSGKAGNILHNATPEYFEKHVLKILNIIKYKKEESNLVFIKSWNEWGEGNYLEPDLKYGKKFLIVLRNCLNSLNHF